MYVLSDVCSLERSTSEAGVSVFFDPERLGLGKACLRSVGMTYWSELEEGLVGSIGPVESMLTASQEARLCHIAGGSMLNVVLHCHGIPSWDMGALVSVQPRRR